MTDAEKADQWFRVASRLHDDCQFLRKKLDEFTQDPAWIRREKLDSVFVDILTECERLQRIDFDMEFAERAPDIISKIENMARAGLDTK